MTDLWIEHCDVCGRRLNCWEGEDFYDEARGLVTCAEHWKGKLRLRKAEGD